MGRAKENVDKLRIGHDLFESEEQKTELEARNGIVQFNEIKRLFDLSDGTLRLDRETIESFHLLAIQGIYDCAGTTRKWAITIRGSLHKPPEHKYVDSLLDEMCLAVNENTDWTPTYAFEILREADLI